MTTINMIGRHKNAMLWKNKMSNVNDAKIISKWLYKNALPKCFFYRKYINSTTIALCSQCYFSSKDWILHSWIKIYCIYKTTVIKSSDTITTMGYKLLQEKYFKFCSRQFLNENWLQGLTGYWWLLVNTFI